MSSKKGDRLNGQIVNTVFQVTAEPPTIAVSINKQNLTHEYIQESKVFSVSILSSETPMKFIGHFGFKSGKELEKFKEVRYKIGQTGAPILLENTIAYLELKVIDQLDVGTHKIFVGELVEAEIIQEGEPLTYAYYREIKGGKSPKTAPSYVKEEPKKELVKGEKYRCTVCGYVYDPKKGDPDSGVKPGTPFDNLPPGWVCPVCGADKSSFEKEV